MNAVASSPVARCALESVAVREAWAQHGVRDFVLDCADELAKIVHETATTGVAAELGLSTRAVYRASLPGSAGEDTTGGRHPAHPAELFRQSRHSKSSEG